MAEARVSLNDVCNSTWVKRFQRKIKDALISTDSAGLAVDAINDGSDLGLKIGLPIAAVVLIFIAVILIIWCRNKHKKKRKLSMYLNSKNPSRTNSQPDSPVSPVSDAANLLIPPICEDLQPNDRLIEQSGAECNENAFNLPAPQAPRNVRLGALPSPHDADMSRQGVDSGYGSQSQGQRRHRPSRRDLLSIRDVFSDEEETSPKCIDNSDQQDPPNNQDQEREESGSDDEDREDSDMIPSRSQRDSAEYA